MARKQRVHYFNAFYHVMLRGNNRQNIFFCDNDRMQFCHYLSEACNIYDCKIHLFCLMTNHLHLVIEVGHIPLSKIMQNISSQYVRYINKNHNRKGYLYEGRYQAIVIQNEKYLLELCYYIHMNPVKAGLTKNIDEFKWSSHGAYNSQVKLSWLTTEFVLSLLKKHVSNIGKKQGYLSFMQDREQCYTKPTFCKFDENGGLVICDAVNSRSQDIIHNKLLRLPINKIAAIICEQMKITIDELSSVSLHRHIVLARSMVTFFAHYRANYQLIDIAIFLERSANSISKTTNRALKLVHSNSKIKELIHSLERKLLESDAVANNTL